MNVFLREKNKDLIKVAKEHSKTYQSAVPFLNISFEDFFDPGQLEAVLGEFPDLSKAKAIEYKNEKERKLASQGEQFFGNETRKLCTF